MESFSAPPRLNFTHDAARPILENSRSCMLSIWISVVIGIFIAARSNSQELIYVSVSQRSNLMLNFDLTLNSSVGALNYAPTVRTRLVLLSEDGKR